MYPGNGVPGDGADLRGTPWYGSGPVPHPCFTVFLVIFGIFVIFRVFGQFSAFSGFSEFSVSVESSRVQSGPVGSQWRPVGSSRVSVESSGVQWSPVVVH